MKWGSTFDNVIREVERKNGRNYKAEADELIDAAIRRFQGCKTRGMDLFRNHVETTRSTNLDTFHRMK